MALEHKRKVLDGKRIELALQRIGRQIIEANEGLDNVALIGIANGGIPVCDRLVEELKKECDDNLPTGTLDITLYRDDLTINDQPRLKNTHLDFDVDGKTIVLVDDVIFTGRSIRAAMSALLDYGRPARIQLAVLVDREHRELPIQADFVGLHLKTYPEEQVQVEVASKPDLKKDKVVVVTPIDSFDEES